VKRQVYERPGDEGEHVVQTRIFEYLVRCDIFAWRNNSGMHGNIHYGLGTGSSDIIGLLPGTGRQEVFRELITAAGGCAFVARSVEEVQRTIEPLLGRKRPQ